MALSNGGKDTGPLGGGQLTTKEKWPRNSRKSRKEVYERNIFCTEKSKVDLLYIDHVLLFSVDLLRALLGVLYRVWLQYTNMDEYPPTSIFIARVLCEYDTGPVPGQTL